MKMVDTDSESGRLKCGAVVIISLVVLRLAIGWHFYKEGAKKFSGDSFTSKHFLQAAKGPLAPIFHGMIPDRKGEQRLSESQVRDRWTAYHARAVRRLRLDEDRKKEAETVLDRHLGQLNAFFAENQADIDEYFLDWRRLEAEQAKPESGHLEYYDQRINEMQSKLYAKPNGWFAQLDQIATQLRTNLSVLATGRATLPAVADPAAGWVDPLVKRVIFGVGLLLIAGLFTRVACLAGAGFLASVLASQPYWATGAKLDFAYYQIVELIALLVLAAVGAGRFAGLDFFLQPFWARCCSGRCCSKNKK